VTTLDGLRPADLGFSYESYRPEQLEAVEQALYGDSAVQGLGLPPGAGKSLVAATIAKLGLPGRTLILTSTKGLEDQYLKDFRNHLVDVRGQVNYPCPMARTCEDGRPMGCGCANPEGYVAAVQQAAAAPVVLSNYSYWLAAGIKAIGNFDTLILDEAVHAVKHLANHLRIAIDDRELHLLRIVTVPPKTGNLTDWQHWVAQIRPLARIAIQDLSVRALTPTGTDRLKRWKRLEEKLARFPVPLPGKTKVEWVFEYEASTPAGRNWTWDVISPKKYTGLLIQGVQRVVLMSATLKKRTLEELGLQGQFTEWGRIFPAERSPVYLCPPRSNGKAVRVDRRTSEEELAIWVRHIDKIIGARLDRKGLIHTVSYARQQFLLQHSQHARFMIANTTDPDSDTASEAADKFRKAAAPAILVSPSFGTGWDFPASQCEFIIVAKVPFQPSQSPLAKAKTRYDPDWMNAEALQELAQSTMRGMRSETDQCEVFITDAHLSWLLGKNRELAPRWFSQSVFSVSAIPKPLTKLPERTPRKDIADDDSLDKREALGMDE